MAVGVDYSMFYLKREREERAAGRSEGAALGQPLSNSTSHPRCHRGRAAACWSQRPSIGPRRIRVLAGRLPRR
ncbi:MAG TPA: hypothetical protein VFD59_02060 [Nocardioidaceae bacterium]|nr:hypothetical protein [Nocardioidaceae bacterium]